MSDTTSLALLVAGFIPILIGALSVTSGRHAAALAWTALGTALHLVGVIARDEKGYAALDAAVFAWCLWTWWNHGGGDNTRRRLRRWARKFRGVRRTAPASSTA